MSEHPPLSALTAVSPADGRYANKLGPLRNIASEYGLMRYRVIAEVAWLVQLATHQALPALANLEPAQLDKLTALGEGFSPEDAARIKAIEQTTNHDVKAVEYFLRQRLAEHGFDTAVQECVHFACTSEDINNVSYALMLRDARDHVLSPLLARLEADLRDAAGRYASLAMLSRTHGQPATPTTLGKEFANFAARLQRQRQSLGDVAILAKFNGAVGNYNAHMAALPDIDWPAVTHRLIRSLGLHPNAYTTQIEPHDWIAEYCHALQRCNTVLLGLCRDVWGYISIGYFRQRTAAGETGSSTMPHKVNPIDFENAEGNIGIADALLGHLAAKLPVSRWQRDLSDSTVLRNVGVAIAHCVLAYKSVLRGSTRLDADRERLSGDLADRWELLAEPIQTVMRAHGLPNGYEQMKQLTRGKAITRELMHEFIRGLDLPDAEKQRLLSLTPASYLGNAAAAASAAAGRD